jgi:hypothetical protein
MLIDRARAAGLTLRTKRAGLTVWPGNRLEPALERELSLSHAAVCGALRAEKAVKDAIRRARRERSQNLIVEGTA